MNSGNDEWFIIKNLDSFVDHSRKLVFSMYGDQTNLEEQDIIDKLSDKDQQELNDILSYDESLTIVKSLVKIERNKKTKKIRYVVNDQLYTEILQSLGDRMTSNILRSLVNKGLIETAYDSDLDDFIFWIKEENK